LKHVFGSTAKESFGWDLDLAVVAEVDVCKFGKVRKSIAGQIDAELQRSEVLPT
jgi:hypothetical protein